MATLKKLKKFFVYDPKKSSASDSASAFDYDEEIKRLTSEIKELREKIVSTLTRIYITRYVSGETDINLLKNLENTRAKYEYDKPDVGKGGGEPKIPLRTIIETISNRFGFINFLMENLKDLEELWLDRRKEKKYLAMSSSYKMLLEDNNVEDKFEEYVGRKWGNDNMLRLYLSIYGDKLEDIENEKPLIDLLNEHNELLIQMVNNDKFIENKLYIEYNKDRKKGGKKRKTKRRKRRRKQTRRIR